MPSLFRSSARSRAAIAVATLAGLFVTGPAVVALANSSAPQDRDHALAAITTARGTFNEAIRARETDRLGDFLVDDVEVVGGSYMAQWRNDGGAWKVRTELFVTLECSGYHCDALIGSRDE